MRSATSIVVIVIGCVLLLISCCWGFGTVPSALESHSSSTVTTLSVDELVDAPAQGLVRVTGCMLDGPGSVYFETVGGRVDEFFVPIRPPTDDEFDTCHAVVRVKRGRFAALLRRMVAMDTDEEADDFIEDNLDAMYPVRDVEGLIPRSGISWSERRDTRRLMHDVSPTFVVIHEGEEPLPRGMANLLLGVTIALALGGLLLVVKGAQRPPLLAAADGDDLRDAIDAFGEPAPGATQPVGSWTETPALSRHRHLAVVDVQAEWPDLCVGCGRPADGSYLPRTLYWHHPAVYIALLSPIIYVILALCLRKRMRTHLPLCRPHLNRRRVVIALAVGLPVLAFAGLCASGRFEPIAFIAAMLLLFTCMIVGVVLSRLVTVRRIDGFGAWVSGVHPNVLRELPPFEETDPAY